MALFLSLFSQMEKCKMRRKNKLVNDMYMQAAALRFHTHDDELKAHNPRC